MDAGNWQRSGDQVFDALAQNDKTVVLAIDELPILVNRMVKGHDYQITPERRQAADEFLSWIRRNGQAHRRRVCLIVSGSIGLEPILRQAGLSAQANIFSSFELHPWSHEAAARCLGALADTYGLDLPENVRHEMCRRLRRCVPHHVQQFFDSLHEHLRRDGKNVATIRRCRNGVRARIAQCEGPDRPGALRDATQNDLGDRRIQDCYRPSHRSGGQRRLAHE